MITEHMIGHTFSNFSCGQENGYISDYSLVINESTEGRCHPLLQVLLPMEDYMAKWFGA